MKSPIANLALLATAASASPIAGRQASSGAFSLDLGFTNNPNLKGLLNANGGKFWVGKPTASYCPDNVPDCAPANVTSFVSDGVRLLLNTGVPGGQQVYVNPDGLLTYTVPHSGAIPEGSLVTGLTRFPNGAFQPFLDFWLCSADPDYQTWQLWLEYVDKATGATVNKGATGTNACYKVNVNTQDYTGAPTWAYE